MIPLLNHRNEVQKRLMDMIASLTSIPIGIYEFNGDQVKSMVPKASRANFEPHCNLIQTFPGGKQRCEADQCNRARNVSIDSNEDLSLCYAGMYNNIVPIRMRDETRAVVIYGEMQVEGAEFQRKAIEKHEKAVVDLGLNENQAAKLRHQLLEARKYTREQLETLKTLLISAGQWFYGLLDEEERARTIVEQTTHELTTRLQAIINSAENLELEVHTLPREEIAEQAEEVVSCALAYDTVVQTIGQHLEDYSFHKESLPRMIREAVRIYKAEAKRRGIDVQITLHREKDPTSIVFASRRHLQLAINNLVHNAIKYSFNSSVRQRFVNIIGQPEANFYRIVISNYGVGILPEEIRDIFLEGYQGKLTQGEYRNGSGKGLYFAKQIINQHRGHIDVESKLATEYESGHARQPHLTKITVLLPSRQQKENR